MTKKLSKKQKIFNKVVRHLGKQRVRSFGPQKTFFNMNACLYRGPNNTKCAIGCLIPNKKYKTSFEGKRASLVNNVLHILPPSGAEFLEGLQQVHDLYKPSTWPKKLRDFGRYYELDISVAKKSFGR